MKPADVLNVKRCLLMQMSQVKAVCVDKDAKIFKFTLPFAAAGDKKIEIFAFQRPKSKKIQLTDGGRVLKAVENTPTAKAFMAGFVKHYGLTLMEDESIMDTSNRPLGVRVSSLMQVLIALDGIHRSLPTNPRTNF